MKFCEPSQFLSKVLNKPKDPLQFASILPVIPNVIFNVFLFVTFLMPTSFFQVVVGWDVSWSPHRPFAIDMAG